MTSLEVRALGPDDDRSAFTCGDDDLDRFFHLYAGQNQFRHHVGVTYVAADGASIHGFVTVAAASIETPGLSARARKRLPAYPLPVLRLARLAVGVQARGQGVGDLLLRGALELTLSMREALGCVGVLVDAKPEAIGFYERYGFERIDVDEGASPVRPQPVPMFLPLGAVPGTA